MNTSINLQLNSEIYSQMIIDYPKLHEITDGELLAVGNLIVNGVPEEIEYEVSKLIFNRVEILELKAEQTKLAFKIASIKIKD